MDVKKFLSKYLVNVSLVFLLQILLVQADLCDVTGGQNAVILDITESLGGDISQKTIPEELPVEGDASTIKLTIPETKSSLFQIDGKQLQLISPLDRDKDDISTIRFEIGCQSRSSSRTKSFPVIIRVADENDNAPVFVGAPYTVSIPESDRIGSLVFDGISAKDLDSGVNGQVIYKLTNVTPSSGLELFDIKLPHQGGIYQIGSLDYETTTSYVLTIEASDLAFRPSDRRRTTTTLKVNILDVDDHNPVFDTASTTNPCPGEEICIEAFEYHSTVIEGTIAGIIDIYPERIHAKDPDLIGAQITYSFQKGYPSNFRDHFKIDGRTAEIKQIKNIDRSDIQYFQIIIQATEETRRRGSSTVKLLINVQGVDTSPPRLIVSSSSGVVQESSPVGTPVLKDDGSGHPFFFSVTDDDYEPGEPLPNYIFELTTSDFQVTKDGILIVANGNLDRDPPSLSVYSFQAIAREDKPNGVASDPLLITVALTDINDNAPRISVYPTISISAGNERRLLLNIQAEDIDEGENSKVRYALLNNGKNKFSIDPITGDLMSIDELEAGEQFQLKIQATDSGGLSGQGFLDVVVSRGRNTNGPIFQKSRYTLAVSESVPFGERVATLKATDPEGDNPYFSIVDGPGSENFEIDTLSGVLSVVQQLDREKQEQYKIVVKAEDREGASNIATVEIRILDVNDEVPTFIDPPYTFRVNEGDPMTSVGLVQAQDPDLNNAGTVSFMIIGDQPFSINSSSGEIKTKIALDYETQQVHYIGVIAKDHGSDPLSTTATVTVLVNDLNDESPIFMDSYYNISIKEDATIGSLITTVQATDPDSQPLITYVIVEGDTDIFKIAPTTGRVTLIGSLDYEKQKNHTIIISTNEADQFEAKSKTTVNVMVKDANDEIPILEPFQTITIPQNAPVGSLLVTAVASDADGTSPNNKIRYELSGVVASVYFEIGTHTGEIRLKKSVQNLQGTEFEVKITATDEGIPPLSTSTEFVIVMLESLEESIPILGSRPNNKASPLATRPRFSKEFVSKSVKEDLDAGTLVLKIPMVNTSSSISCSILDSNAGDQFRVVVTREQSCALQAMRPLDYETQNSYALTLVLHPASVSVSSVVYDSLLALSKAQVNLTVINVNDNSPIFEYDDSYIPIKLAENKIVMFIMEEAASGTQLLTLKAKDLDAINNSLITYELDPQSNRGNYFTVNQKTGRVVTQRSLTNVPAELIPFNLTFIATDTPDQDGLQLSTKLNIMVPIIEKSQRALALIDASKDQTENKAHVVMDILSETTGRLAQIEEIRSPRRSTSGNFTQIWFHMLDSQTLEPIDPKFVYEDKTKHEVIQRLKGISGFTEAQLITPSELSQQRSQQIVSRVETTTRGGIVKIGTATSFRWTEYAVIALSILIIVFVFIAIMAVFILWSRFSRGWKRAEKMMMIPPVVTRSGGSVIDGLSKEYEVQVLHMSVPLDDDSMHEFLPSESPQQLFLDNVSYISKTHTNHDGTSSDGSGRGTPGGMAFDSSEFSPVFSSSSTNENVLFGRRLDQSPVETTTEL